jgi:hypothetical protein
MGAKHGQQATCHVFPCLGVCLMELCLQHFGMKIIIFLLQEMVKQEIEKLGVARRNSCL